MSGFNGRRRNFLKGLGGLAALPLLEALPGVDLLGNAWAAPGGPPKRFIVMWTPNGTVPKNWHCSGTENSFTFSPILKPLEAVREDVLVIDGIDALSAYTGPGDAHQRATGQCLTGRALQEGNFLGASGRSAGWADGISIDQAIADHVGQNTAFRSLELGVYVSGANVNSRLSYRGPAQPLPPENDPSLAFQRLFGNEHENPQEKADRIARRRSVLDAVSERYRRLIPRVSSADRVKLEAHLASIRDIESRLSAGGGGMTCSRPGAPPTIDPTKIGNVPELGRLQMDLLVAALSCNLTQVATLMWMNSATDKTYPWLDVHDGHHELAHRGDSDTDAVDKLTKIYNWYAGEFAYLIQKLKSVPEGGGTLLDNTFVVWISEHSKGNEHDRHELPYVAAGRAGGAIRPGRLLKLSGEVPHNNLWVSALNTFGIETDTFGDPNFCTGPLSGLA